MTYVSIQIYICASFQIPNFHRNLEISCFCLSTAGDTRGLSLWGKRERSLKPWPTGVLGALVALPVSLATATGRFLPILSLTALDDLMLIEMG